MRFARVLALGIAVLTVLGAGGYLFVYLYRWEFHRALIAGVIFVGAEVALAAVIIVRKLNDAASRNDERTSSPPRGALDPAVLARIREAAPQREHFAWLRREQSTNVFITVLLGGGILVSAIAWAVEKVAGGTATASFEEDLAHRLSTIAFPREGLVAADEELLAQAGPYASDRRLRLLLGPEAGPARR